MTCIVFRKWVEGAPMGRLAFGACVSVDAVKFAKNDGSVQEMRRKHPLTQEWREMATSFDDTGRVIPRHRGVMISWSRCFSRLLHIHQADIIL